MYGCTKNYAAIEHVQWSFISIYFTYNEVLLFLYINIDHIRSHAEGSPKLYSLQPSWAGDTVVYLEVRMP